MVHPGPQEKRDPRGDASTGVGCTRRGGAAGCIDDPGAEEAATSKGCEEGSRMHRWGGARTEVKCTRRQSIQDSSRGRCTLRKLAKKIKIKNKSNLKHFSGQSDMVAMKARNPLAYN